MRLGLWPVNCMMSSLVQAMMKAKALFMVKAVHSVMATHLMGNHSQMLLRGFEQARV